MTIPHKIKIRRGVHYKVVYVDKFDLEDQIGECDDDAKIIYLRKNLKGTELKKTFIHELLHAIEFEYSINLKHESVYQLEEALYDIICWNRNVFERERKCDR